MLSTPALLLRFFSREVALRLLIPEQSNSFCSLCFDGVTPVAVAYRKRSRRLARGIIIIIIIIIIVSTSRAQKMSSFNFESLADHRQKLRETSCALTILYRTIELARYATPCARYARGLSIVNALTLLRVLAVADVVGLDSLHVLRRRRRLTQPARSSCRSQARMNAERVSAETDRVAFAATWKANTTSFYRLVVGFFFTPFNSSAPGQDQESG